MAFERSKALFEKQFGADGTEGVVAAFAPGRVNLIGEHTDYCDGFVFPMVVSFTFLL
jgi:galactokinase